MRVNIDEIKEAGLRRAWDVARDDVDALVSAHEAGFRARGPAHVEASLEKVERRVLLDAHAKAELTVPCGRCLAPVSVDVPADFELTLVPSDEYAREPHAEKDKGRAQTGSFDPETAEEELYSGKEIDLDPLVREQLLLALPSYPVCREDCKGLCPVCGTNLNERECGCERKPKDPRWAALEKFKLQ
jgi:uncharacterized protein